MGFLNAYPLRGYCNKEEKRMSKPIKTISAEELYYMQISHRETEMIVDEMIPQGLTILAGPSKSGKSWLVLDMGLAVAAGEPLLGKETIKCGVLYFALEDRAARLQKRLHLIEEEEPPDNLYLATECPPLEGGFLDSLHDHLKAHPDIRLVIVDTLQMIREGDGKVSSGNQYGQETDELSMLKKFAEARNIAIVIVHHVVKNIDPVDPVNDIRGSTGMSATPDSILILRKKRVQKNGELTNISRDYPQWKMKLLFDQCRWHLEELITEDEMAKEEIPPVLYRIAEMIETRERWDGTMSQLLEEIGEHEMTPNALSRKIAQYGSLVFDPMDIQVSQTRTSKERRYTFIHQPTPAIEMACSDDISDEILNDEESSSSSLSSSSPPMSEEERAVCVERARQTVFGHQAN